METLDGIGIAQREVGMFDPRMRPIFGKWLIPDESRGDRELGEFTASGGFRVNNVTEDFGGLGRVVERGKIRQRIMKKKF